MMLYDKNAVRMWNRKHYFITYLQKKKKLNILKMHFVYTQIHNICTPPSFQSTDNNDNLPRNSTSKMMQAQCVILKHLYQ